MGGGRRIFGSFAQYGLTPGDTIRLFGRVEDDPAGAKGAKSAAATINIISQEDFEALLRGRRGLTSSCPSIGRPLAGPRP